MDEKTHKILDAIDAEIAKIEIEKRSAKDSTDLGLMIGRQGGLIEAKHIILKTT